MNNIFFHKTKKLVFALALALGLLLPASTTLALPQKTAPATDIIPVNPTDPYYSDNSQWNLNGANGINAPTAWGITQGINGTVVAMIGTGVADYHADLEPNRILTGYDFIDSDATLTEPSDCLWQGTHLVGIIGAQDNNGIGIAGINWNSGILPVRVASCSSGVPSVTADNIMKGIKWAAGITGTGATPDVNPNPANVINVGVGVSGVSCDTYQSTIDAIVLDKDKGGKGAVIVAAAGDGNSPTLNFPANCTGVISVAGTDANGYLATNSNNGAAVKISAPGVGVLSTTKDVSDSIYEQKSGTNVAAAQVSGVVSLMFAANPRITPAQVLEILQTTATTFPTSGGTGTVCTISTCGNGIVNAGEAVRVANMPDLIITGVTLSKTYPTVDDTFDVNIIIKNQGGENLHDLNSNGVVDRTVYIDADPAGFPENPTCLIGYGPLPPGGTTVFTRNADNESIPSGYTSWPAGATKTYPVTIHTSELPGDPEAEHDIYAFADADCNITEGFEHNNGFAAVKVNPVIHGALTYPEQGANIGTDYTPTFKWNDVVNATWYELYLSGPSGVILDQYYDASLICGPVNGLKANKCAAVPNPIVTLAAGTYGWYMRSYNATDGWSAWSNNQQPTNFTIAAPAAAVLTEPKGSITNYTPTYKWGKVTGATYYRLYVSGPSGVVLDQWYKTSDICDRDGAPDECSVVSPALLGGAHVWYVQTYSPAGYGPWSNNVQPTDFNTPSTPPTAATSLVPGTVNPATPEDIGTNYTPTYSWDKITGATWYRLYVSGPSGVALDQWYQAEVICPSTCSVTSPLLGGGTYSWYVQTYGPAGYGPWSNTTGNVTQPVRFMTSSTPPTAATSLDPGTVNPATPTDIGTNYTPTYSWDKITAATWYRLYVSGPSGVVLDQWYQASSICPSTCSVTSPLLGGGTYSWYVQTYGPAGYGPWSNTTGSVIQPVRFTTSSTPPEAATSLVPGTVNPATPEDIGTNYTPTYSWDKITVATWYRLYVSGPSGVVLDHWYQAADICPSTCSVTSPTLGGGTYSWYVQTYGPAGYGPWSNTTGSVIQPMRFITSSTPPAAAILTYPVEGDPMTLPVTGVKDIGPNYTPTYTWNKVVGATYYATYYRLYVAGPSGVVLDQWYKTSDICDRVGAPDVCSVVSPALQGGNYDWYVQTYSPAGFGPWSNNVKPMKFHTQTTALPAADLIQPRDDGLADGQYIGKEYNPTYEWNKVEGATYYRLYVASLSNVILDQWYKASDICNSNPTPTCVVGSLGNPTPTLGGGRYGWYVMTYGPTGYGSWSNDTQPTKFWTDPQTIPMAAANLSLNRLPNDNQKQKPTYTWDRTPVVTWNHLYVKGSYGVVLDQWYRSVDVCKGNVCSVVSPTLLENTDYTWWVQTYNSAGYGPWKSATFKVQSVSAATTGLLPTGETTDTAPSYTWNKISTATKYHLYVSGPSGVALDQWYESSSVCGASCSVVSPTLVTGDYTWWVLTYNSSAGYGIWKSGSFKVIP